MLRGWIMAFREGSPWCYGRHGSISRTVRMPACSRFLGERSKDQAVCEIGLFLKKRKQNKRMIFFFYMCVPSWLLVSHVHAVSCGGQKRASNQLDLELQVVLRSLIRVSELWPRSPSRAARVPASISLQPITHSLQCFSAFPRFQELPKQRLLLGYTFSNMCAYGGWGISFPDSCSLVWHPGRTETVGGLGCVCAYVLFKLCSL